MLTGSFAKRYLQLEASYVSSSAIQGGEDTEDTSRYRSFSEKEPLIVGLFCENNL